MRQSYRSVCIAALCLTGIGFLPRLALGQTVLAEAYIASADVAREHSDLPKAARLYALALAESHGAQHAVLTAHALMGAASVHIELDELTQAEENVRAALELCDGMQNPPKNLLEMGLNCMAMISYHRDEFEQAEACYVKLLKDLEPTEANQVVRGIVLNDLALVQIALKQPEDARHLATAAAEIMHAEFGETSAHYAQCLDTLAQAYHAENRLDDAERLSIASLEICAADIGAETPQYGSALLTLGKVQHGRGKHSESAKTTEMAVAIQEEHRGPNHPLVKQAKEDHAALHHAAVPVNGKQAAHDDASENVAARSELSSDDDALFHSVFGQKDLSPDVLKAARDRWSQLTPDQRRAAAHLFQKSN